MEIYEAALKGTREEAINIIDKIVDTVVRYGDCGTKDARRHQLMLCYNILRKICVVITNYNGKHYDIYCDILERAFEPHIEPPASPQYWSRYLEYWRYFHYLMIEKKQFKEASRICAHIATQPCLLIKEDDYKLIMSTYCQHLLAQRAHKLIDKDAAEKEIIYVLNQLIDLFGLMRKSNVNSNFTYPELVTHFIEYLFSKRTIDVYEYFRTLPANGALMFDAFFNLLSHIKRPELPSQLIELHARNNIIAFRVFFEMDSFNNLKYQLALKHMRICRESQLFQNDKAIGYVFTLLYYYIKFAYARENTNISNNTYSDLCQKLSIFFDKHGPTLICSHWFMDFIAVINLFFQTLHQYPSIKNPFNDFWSKLNTFKCFLAHFQLMSGCIKLAGRVTDSKLITLKCCSSVRKHLILNFAQATLIAYFYFAQNIEESAIPTNILDATFLQIMRHAIDVVNSMTCIGEKPNDLYLEVFYTRITKLTRAITTAAQARLCVKLCESLTKIKRHFANTDWSLLLRRIYKTALITDDRKLIKQLYCYYIASMVHVTPLPDLAYMRNQISIFHTSAANEEGDKCLLEIYEMSVSELKPVLEPQHKRLLHWMDLQHINEYKKLNVALRNSLVRTSQTDYDMVMSVRGGKLNPKGATKMEAICKTIKQKANGNMPFSRLEQLTLAHARTILLRAQTEKKPSSIETKDCVEDKLDDLLQRKELLNISLSTEWLILDQALECLKAFEAFYYTADAEYLPSDEVYIDWKFILDDIASIANIFHLSGYIQYATDAWLLHYSIADTIDDQYNCLRGLAYFCENSEHMENYGKNKNFTLQEHINKKMPFMLESIQNMLPMLKRHQNYLLLCLSQLAYYYARNGNLKYAEMLIKFVEYTHNEIPDRANKYDIIMCTLNVIKFRILWKHLGNELSATKIDWELKQHSVLRHAILLVEEVRNVHFICSDDYTSLIILMYGVSQQLTECAANRLTDNILSGFFISILKIAIQMGLALRIVQILSSWMWTNLQMEHISKAQTKLKLIECVLGLGKCSIIQQMKKELQMQEPIVNRAYTQVICMEPIRKVQASQMSPIKEDLNLSPTVLNQDLTRFLKCSNKMLKEHDILEWTYFNVGCLNARLLFLAFQHDNLEEFYENCQTWLLQNQNKLPPTHYPNVKLICMQHYANLLRVNKKYKKAIKCLENIINETTNMNRNIDAAYRINFLLQISAAKREFYKGNNNNVKPQQQQLRRALEYNISLENKPITNILDKKQKPNSKEEKWNNKKALLESKPRRVPYVELSNANQNIVDLCNSSDEEHKPFITTTSIDQTSNATAQTDCNIVDKMKSMHITSAITSLRKVSASTKKIGRPVQVMPNLRLLALDDIETKHNKTRNNKKSDTELTPPTPTATTEMGAAAMSKSTMPTRVTRQRLQKIKDNGNIENVDPSMLSICSNSTSTANENARGSRRRRNI